ncbi:DUF5610 domain-containing protein [Shewanella sp. NIFS-20-20]|uniref:DUF5610 domain-containing protein n=1 Tax=Shewanella sp. NIFS-20-20 TaxID=2853806 RepID=UPI001C46E3B7|nr:DUF5610 domain-containing protein [Shewanella sp. NIFS-20-20]MBV7314653.1 DUF5610 domain-containing protein [Shewanella sp. NIFS-20-20]
MDTSLPQSTAVSDTAVRRSPGDPVTIADYRTSSKLLSRQLLQADIAVAMAVQLESQQDPSALFFASVAQSIAEQVGKLQQSHGQMAAYSQAQDVSQSSWQSTTDKLQQLAHSSLYHAAQDTSGEPLQQYGQQLLNAIERGMNQAKKSLQEMGVLDQAQLEAMTQAYESIQHDISRVLSEFDQ